MSSLKQIKLSEKSAVRQQQLVSELNSLVNDIGRCEKTITELQRELGEVNTKYPKQRTTREDIAYLTDLLKCANKKLAWEKNIASLQKRTPVLLEEMSRSMNDPQNPPSDQTRSEMLRSLHALQAAMEQLQNVKPV
jgi:hypothetical protein